MSDVNVTALTIGLSVTAGVILVLILLILVCDRGYRRRSLKGRHVVVTGGSSGIGKAMACLAAKEGAKVTIIARNQARLDQAKQEVEEKGKNGQVRTLSADLCCDPETVKDSLSDIGNDTDPYGPVFMLVNCAGSAIPGRFEEANDSDFKRMMNLNYFGSVWTTRALLPSLKRSPGGGSIVFVSSQAALVGIYGYSAYAPSKYAIRGLAEVLSMEVAPFDITVTVGFPPDTDTPGFEEENKGKPEETKLLSETAGLFKPSEVAKATLEDALRGHFFTSPGTDGWLLSNLNVGMTDSSVARLIPQVLLLGIFRLIAFFYRRQFASIINKCKKNRDNEVQKSKGT